MRERQYFTEAEATALLGKHIRTRRGWSGVRTGTTGMITQAEESASRLGWIIGITWDWPLHAKPLQGWFDRGEYEH